MADHFDDLDDLLDDDSMEGFDVLVLTDDETGEDIELIVIDRVSVDKRQYLLVIEAQDIDSEESIASILKETDLEGGDVTYEIVDDDDEFEEVSKLFEDTDDFEIK